MTMGDVFIKNQWKGPLKIKALGNLADLPFNNFCSATFWSLCSSDVTSTLAPSLKTMDHLNWKLLVNCHKPSHVIQDNLKEKLMQEQSEQPKRTERGMWKCPRLS